MTTPQIKVVDEQPGAYRLMREARIIVPQFDNDGHSIQGTIEKLDAALCRQFHGFTRIPAHGGWQHPDGHIQTEASWVYEIACDTSEATADKLRTLVEHVRDRARQLCVYCRFPDGHVELI